MTDRFVLMDFDGVIADSFALASALAARVCKENTPERYRSAFEGNIYDAVEKDKPGGKRPDHGPECEHDIDWWDEYEKGFTNVGTFPGVIEAIKELSQRYRLAIITSGHARFIRPFLELHGVAPLFTDILDVDTHTHKTKKIEIMFDKYGVNAADCVFVTDTLGDIREAAHHRIGSIACAWGFHPRGTLELGAPFRIIDSGTELSSAVGDYFARV